MGIRRKLSLDHVREQLRIGNLKEGLECQPFFCGSVRVPLFEVALQQDIELPHAAATTPLQAGQLARWHAHAACQPDVNAAAQRSSA